MKQAILRVLLWAVSLLTTGVSSYIVGNGLNFQGMEENCILSFVVPRDKMKSSCDVDDKMRRRLNSVDMKVNIYKQQMAELQAQLDKERQLNAENMEKMARQVRESTASADMSFLVERRLALLENEFSQMNADMAGYRAKSPNHLPLQQGAPTFPFNAVDSSPVKLPNLVKSMVEAQVRSVFDNFTKKFETYVRDQILVYNQVFSMLHKQGPRSPGEENTSADVDLVHGSTTLKQSGRSHGPLEPGLRNKFEQVKADLDRTGEEIAKKVEDYIHKNMSATKSNSTVDGRSDSARAASTNSSVDKDGNLVLVPGTETAIEEDGLEANDSFSGENETLSQETFTHAVNTDISVSGAARSRISGTHKGGNASDMAKWKDNMIGDENYKQAKAEKRLRDEITALLYEPLARVMNMMEKETTMMEEKLKEHADLSSKATRELDGRIQSLDESVQSNTVQLQSVSKGFQDSFVRLDKIASLENSINEIKVNLSSDSAGMPAHELDQQNKKMKKLERLMNVYQQSLEHYKNDTKLECNEVREKLTRETLNMKKAVKSLRSDVSNRWEKAIEQMNRSHSNQLEDMKVQIRKNEDNIIINQIDISNNERHMNEKKDRTSRNLNDVKDTLSQVLSKNRECRKKIDNLQKKHSAMRDQVNMTAQAIADLKKEVRLNLIDDWMKTTFDYDASISNCFGEQYVKRLKLPNSSAKLVGVVLCSHSRYKILMSQSLQSMFLNIGDGRGLGEDHCEFVGASSEKNVTLAPYEPKYRTFEGYTRDVWGQAPRKTFLNDFKPSPPWYECGVSIP